jgi:NCAIR mutase (PurE)-related protein
MKAMYHGSNQTKTIIATKVDRSQFDAIKNVLNDDVAYIPGPMIAHTIKKLADKTHQAASSSSRSTGGHVSGDDEKIAGKVAVFAAGTSDYNIAEEAAVLLELSGIENVVRVYDVGVAGLHRLLSNIHHAEDADVVIVCAGE